MPLETRFVTIDRNGRNPNKTVMSTNTGVQHIAGDGNLQFALKYRFKER